MIKEIHIVARAYPERTKPLEHKLERFVYWNVVLPGIVHTAPFPKSY